MSIFNSFLRPISDKDYIEGTKKILQISVVNDGEIPTAESADNAPPSPEQPTTEHSHTEQPIVEQPIAEQPIAEQPTAAQSEPTAQIVEPTSTDSRDASAQPEVNAVPAAEGTVTATEAAKNTPPSVDKSPSERTAPVTNATHSDIADHFAKKGITLDTARANPQFAPVGELAMFMAKNHVLCKDFYKAIKQSLTAKRFEFSYSFDGLSKAEIMATKAVADKMAGYGILADLNKTSGIKATLSSAPRVINFLNGDYLEFFSRHVISETVKRAAATYNTDCEIMSNVSITKNNELHELDVVFSIGDEVFWCEVKSGNFNADKYRMIGLILGVNPAKHILLGAEKTDEEAQGMSWFYECYVANISTFKNKLKEMIDTAFAKENK